MSTYMKVIRVFWSLLLTLGLAPLPLFASNTGDVEASLTSARNGFGPIGTVFSLGGMSIDGRIVTGEQMIWGGELLCATQETCRIKLYRIGHIILYKGASARLVIPIVNERYGGSASVLSVVMLSGEMSISLDTNAVANVDVGGALFSASASSWFRIGFRGEDSIVEVEKGWVWETLQQRRIRYRVVSAIIDPQTQKDIGQGPDKYRVPANEPVKVPVVVKKPQPSSTGGSLFQTNPKLVKYQLPQTEQAASDIDVEFCLGNPAVGSFSGSGTSCEVARTNQYGVAVVEFRAGSNAGSSTITATVVTSREDFWRGEIEVFKVAGFWRTRNILILAAVAGGVTICAFKCHPREPLRQVPPPSIP